ncbi:hypothetical protein STENM223S_06385 [Streptomyces tendae]
MSSSTSAAGRSPTMPERAGDQEGRMRQAQASMVSLPSQAVSATTRLAARCTRRACPVPGSCRSSRAAGPGRTRRSKVEAPPVLAARGEALEQPEEDQQRRRPEAHRRVRRQQADRGRADRHENHRQGEDLLRPILSPIGPKTMPPSGRTRNATAKVAKEDRSCTVVPRGEEDPADGAGQVGVDPEVEPFHGVAERGGLHRALDRPLVRHRDVRPPQRRVLPAADGAEQGRVALVAWAAGSGRCRWGHVARSSPGRDGATGT